MLPVNRNYQKISIHLRREALLRIYKSFVRPNLDYRDIIFNKPNYESFKSKIESMYSNVKHV